MDAIATQVIDEETFEIVPGWAWRGNTGNRVRPAGWAATGADAVRTLAEKVVGKIVTVGRVATVDGGRLVAEVIVNGENLGLPASGL